MIQAVLFDLDGTLTNTLQDIADAMNRALRLNGLPEWPVDAYRYLVGRGAKNLSVQAVRGRQDLQPKVLAEYQAYYETHTQVVTRPYDGVPEMLEQLDRRGIRLCVFSNKPHADTVNVVRHFFPDTPWAVIRGQQEGIPTKPDPAGALRTAEAAGVSPSNFLYLGDTATDMECAVRSGMKPVGALWGFRDEKELRGSGADIVLKKPLDMVDLIDRMNKE